MIALLLTLFACTENKPIVGDDTGADPVDDTPDADGDGYLASVDCDDTVASVHPGAAETWYDGVDQDCDGRDDDQDGDGVMASLDCDDTSAAIYPGAGEVPDDGVDQDCDGADSTGGGGSTIVDADGDGYTDAVDCDEGDPAVHPAAEDSPGDGIDQDCDGADDLPPDADADADGDGYAAEAYSGTDCDDTDAAVHPGATEVVGDDVDSDCDGGDFGIDALAEGDLVITEIMYNPSAVSDADGEWFELTNETGHAVNLYGLVVADDSAYGAADLFTVEDDLVAEAGARLVFAVNDDSTLNGGVTVDYDFAGGGVNFNNSADELYVGVPSGRGYDTIDSVSYDELSRWPAATGASIELRDSSVSASANDTASNWCQATSAMSGGDLGSPGAVSSGC